MPLRQSLYWIKLFLPVMTTACGMFESLLFQCIHLFNHLSAAGIMFLFHLLCLTCLICCAFTNCCNECGHHNQISQHSTRDGKYLYKLLTSNCLHSQYSNLFHIDSKLYSAGHQKCRKRPQDGRCFFKAKNKTKTFSLESQNNMLCKQNNVSQFIKQDCTELSSDILYFKPNYLSYAIISAF